MMALPLLVWATVVLLVTTLLDVCGIARQFRGLTVFALGFVGLGLLIDFRNAAAVVFYGPVALGLWPLAGVALMHFSAGRQLWLLAAWRWAVGRHLRTGLRRWLLYDRRWAETLDGLHLTRPDLNSDRLKVPKLKKVTIGPFSDKLKVKLLLGQTARMWQEANDEEGIAKAFHGSRCVIRDVPRTDYITLEISRDDPLADPIPFPGIPRSTADVDLTAIPIGIDEHGRVVTVPLLGAHLMVGGITGSGKGSIIWSIILHLVPFIREGSVRLWGVDPKRGVELFPGRRMFAEYCDGDSTEIAELLKRAVTVMDDGGDWLKSQKLRKLTPTPEHPLNVIIVDELGRLSEDKECTVAIKTLVNVGRAIGMSLVGLLQNPTKETARWRDEVPVKAALALASSDYVKMLLGREAYLAGARCDEIPLDMPGCGYIKQNKIEGQPTPPKEPVRFRAYWVSNELIDEVNESMPPLDGETEPVKTLEAKAREAA